MGSRLLLYRHVPRLRFRSSFHSLFPSPVVRFAHSTPSSSPTTTDSAALPPHPPPVLTSAINDLTALPELDQATNTTDLSLRHTLLTRLFQISTQSTASDPDSPSPHAAIAHTLLARHAHHIGDVPSERAHRIHAISHLTRVAAIDAQNTLSHHAVLSAAHIALTLCCLRAPGAEMRLAASAAASDAVALAVTSPTRMAASLLSALSATPSRRTLLLSALTAVDDSPPPVPSAEGGPPDITGYARYFIASDATASSSTSSETVEPAVAVDHALALVTRWDGRSHDFVEALVQAADTLRVHRRAKGFEMAEDCLTRAVQEAGRVGNEADKGEPLLGMARLCIDRRMLVEAEGYFRAVESRFEPMWNRKAFTVASADLFCRFSEQYANFLDSYSVNDRPRTSEANEKRDRGNQVRRELFPHVLSRAEESDPHNCAAVPAWFVQSMLPHFDLSLPL